MEASTSYRSKMRLILSSPSNEDPIAFPKRSSEISEEISNTTHYWSLLTLPLSSRYCLRQRETGRRDRFYGIHEVASHLIYTEPDLCLRQIMLRLISCLHCFHQINELVIPSIRPPLELIPMLIQPSLLLSTQRYVKPAFFTNRVRRI